MQAVYKKLGAFSYGSLSVAEQVLSRTVALPIHAALSIDEASFVVDKVKLLLEQQISH
jgi:dTDP-4-amino-4,6-dideoxygalactose transaminase